MTIRRLCVQEVTTITESFTEAVTCTNPDHAPIGVGDECRTSLYNTTLNLTTAPPTVAFSFDVQWEYLWDNNGTTFQDFCDVMGQSGSFTLPSSATADCIDGATVTGSITCLLGSMTATSTYVSGEVQFDFTVTNLCSQTIICVDDTTCP